MDHCTAPVAAPVVVEGREDQPEAEAGLTVPVAVALVVVEDIPSWDLDSELAEDLEEAVVHIPCNPEACRVGSHTTELPQGYHTGIPRPRLDLNQALAGMEDSTRHPKPSAVKGAGRLYHHHIYHGRHHILQECRSR